MHIFNFIVCAKYVYISKFIRHNYIYIKIHSDVGDIYSFEPILSVYSYSIYSYQAAAAFLLPSEREKKAKRKKRDN